MKNISRLLIGSLLVVFFQNWAIAASVVDQQQPVIDISVGGLVIGGSSQQKLAQVVTAGVSGVLTEVRFPVACGSGDLVIDVQGVTGGKPNGVVLASQTIPGSSLPSFFPTPGVVSFRSLVFSAPVFFSAGSQFAIVLSSSGQCGVFQGPIGDSYLGGNAYFDARPNLAGVWVCICDFAGARFDLPFQAVVDASINQPPVASAGPDQAVTLIGSTIQLDGSQSYDPDGVSITYQWSFISIPAGSAATLSNPNIVNPTFIADVQRTYVAQLIVSDPWSQSAPATVTISFQNIKPVASAGTSQSAAVGDTVALDGSGSSDANGDPLTYQWSFASVPAGSMSAIASPTSMATSFVPDLPGTYVAQLIVNDGFVNSDPSTVEVQVITKQTEVILQIQNFQRVIASLDPLVLKNANMRNALINKLSAVLTSIDSGNYASALHQLQNDILGKMNGCATTGAPDNNDWINTCYVQEQVNSYLMNIIQLVQSMS